MNKFKSLYQGGLFIVSFFIFVIVTVVVTLSPILGDILSKKNQSEKFTTFKSESKEETKVVEPVVKIQVDTIYIEKKVQVPCNRNHCETPAVNDSIVP